MKRVLALSMILVSAAQLCGGDEKGDVPFRGFEEFQQRFGKVRIDQTTQNDTQNLVDFLHHANRYPWTWIQLIEKYNLYDELDISERQRDELTAVQSPTAISVAEHMSGGKFKRHLRKPKKAFWKWVRTEWSREMNRHHGASNDVVESILKPEQVTRLRQIGFQFQAVLHAGAHAAYRMHNIKLTDEQANELRGGFARGKQLRFPIQEMIAYRERCKIVADEVGKETFNSATGQLVYFGQPLDPDIMSELFGDDDEKPSPTNPRRRDR